MVVACLEVVAGSLGNWKMRRVGVAKRVHTWRRQQGAHQWPWSRDDTMETTFWFCCNTIRCFHV
jgi:hypothetical protein